MCLLQGLNFNSIRMLFPCQLKASVNRSKPAEDAILGKWASRTSTEHPLAGGDGISEAARPSGERRGRRPPNTMGGELSLPERDLARDQEQRSIGEKAPFNDPHSRRHSSGRRGDRRLSLRLLSHPVRKSLRPSRLRSRIQIQTKKSRPARSRTRFIKECCRIRPACGECRSRADPVRRASSRRWRVRAGIRRRHHQCKG